MNRRQLIGCLLLVPMTLLIAAMIGFIALLLFVLPWAEIWADFSVQALVYVMGSLFCVLLICGMAEIGKEMLR